MSSLTSYNKHPDLLSATLTELRCNKQHIESQIEHSQTEQLELESSLAQLRLRITDLDSSLQGHQTAKNSVETAISEAEKVQAQIAASCASLTRILKNEVASKDSSTLG